MNPDWMLIRLGQETRAHHAAADRDRLALMDVSSAVEYRTLLAQVYGFETAVDHALLKISDLDHRVLGGRTTLRSLHGDLVALGMSSCDVEALPRCSAIALRTPAHALGWLFVVERSALVAGLIRRYLASQQPELVRVASGYLDASSRDAGARLRAFGAVLGSYARRGVAAPEAIVTSAVRAFQLQHHWYTRVGRVRAGTIRRTMGSVTRLHVRRTARRHAACSDVH